MKKNIVLTALVSLFLAVTAVSAQDKKADFSGVWELDAGKSKMGERMRVESITMNVSQTDKELKIESAVKRAAAPSEGEQRGGNGGGMRRGGGMGRGMGGDGTQNAVYSLDGKETKTEQTSPMGAVPVSLKAKWEKDGKLKLSSTRTMETPMGSMTMTVKETWSLSPDGKTLTIVREQETPRGSFSSEMVFTKK